MTWQKYFTHNELACRCCQHMKVMDSFLVKLTELRQAWNKPMIVNSCCRCQKHNDSVGGASKSFHLFGHPELTGIGGTAAIDISTTRYSTAEKYALVKLAMDKGWSVGVAKTFLHFDRRSDYPETNYKAPVLFTY